MSGHDGVASVPLQRPWRVQSLTLLTSISPTPAPAPLHQTEQMVPPRAACTRHGRRRQSTRRSTPLRKARRLSASVPSRLSRACPSK
eukprot:COSAG06_NODE_1248_length_10110_cov_19.070223_7_plen_87_part_00